MSWGIELWDQFENVSAHTQKSLDYCEKVIHFYKERCGIENEYAGKLRKLVKGFNSKKKDEEEFTCNKGFLLLLKEIYDMAGQHEAIAESINSTIVKDLNLFMLDYKQQRKKLLQDGAKQQAVLNAQMDKLERSKKKYEKAFMEAERAAETYKKNEQDINLAKIEIDKSKSVMMSRLQTSDDCKSEYALEVQNTKKAQAEHYEKIMPDVFQQLQTNDEKRVLKIKEMIETTTKIEREVVPIVNRCIDGMSSAAEKIDPGEDSKMVVEKYKTGFPMPNDIPFEDLSQTGSGSSNTGGHSRAAASVRSKKKQGILGIFSAKQQEEPKEDFSHLPPNQQRKQLLCKIDSLKSALQKEYSARDGLNKMKDVYMSNKNLGDPAILEKQDSEIIAKISKLETELQKYESFLSDNHCRNASPGASPAVVRRDNDDTISTSSRASTASNQYAQIIRPTVPSSPDVSFKHQDSFSDDDDSSGKTCVALYEYQGTGDESSLAMKVGERFALLSDEGDGWLQVKRVSNGDVGYVPSSYVKYE